MHIIVLIKQVPEMEKVKFDRENGVIDRETAGVEINPFDLNALQTAVNIKEKLEGKITAISMGPERAEKALKSALARGADEGILISDSKFAGADTISTSRTLAEAVKKIGEFDLIVGGEMSVDGDTAQVGPQTAEFLDIPHIAYVSQLLKVNKEELRVLSHIWGADYEKSIRFPALMTVTKDINTPSLPSFKDKMKARKAEIKHWTFKDFSEQLKDEEVGLAGSPTWVSQINIPPAIDREGLIWEEEELETAVNELYEVLRQNRVIENDK